MGQVNTRKVQDTVMSMMVRRGPSLDVLRRCSLDTLFLCRPRSAELFMATESQSDPVMVSLLDLAPFTWWTDIHTLENLIVVFFIAIDIRD